MPGIPPDLYSELRRSLLECGPVENHLQLEAMFVDDRLSPWRYSVPQSDSVTARVDVLVNFLYTRQREDTGINALVLFLQVLSERLDQADAHHHRLKNLADMLEAALDDRISGNRQADSPSNRSAKISDVSSNVGFRLTAPKRRSSLRDFRRWLLGE